MDSAIETIKTLASAVKQFIFPVSCISCGSLLPAELTFCSACYTLITKLVPIFLPITTSKALTVHAAGAYEGPLKDLVLKKFNGNMLASRQLGKIILEATPVSEMKFDVIIPIPLHWQRYSMRGFNQAKVIASVLGEHFEVPVRSMLYRNRRTVFQSRLSMSDRRTNVEDAFAIHPWHFFNRASLLKGKKILLVDDLCTTGSTLMSAAKALQKLRPESITAVVGSRAV